MVRAGADGERRAVAGLDGGVGAEAGDVVVAGEFEVDHRFVAHVFDDVERDGGERQAVAAGEQVFGADAERGGAVRRRVAVERDRAAAGEMESFGPRTSPLKKFIAGLPMNEPQTGWPAADRCSSACRPAG